MVSGDDERKASAWLDRFAEVLGREPRLEVTTASALAQLLGLERQRQLLGCDQESSTCLAELAAALGSDGVLSGVVTRSGESFLAVLRIIRQPGGKVWWSASARVRGEEALLDWLDAQAEQAAVALVGVRPPTGATVPATPVPLAPLLLGGLGLAAAAVGTGLLVEANTRTLPRLEVTTSEQERAAAVEAYRAQTTAGVLAAGVGGSAVLASAIALLAAPKRPGAPAAALVPLGGGGAVVSLSGRW